MRFILSKFWFSAVILAGTFTVAVGQKKVLTHDDYDQWKSISSVEMTRDGRFLMWEKNPQEGDGTLILHNTQTKAQLTFERGTSAKFDFEGKWLVFQVKPKYEVTRKAKLKKTKKEDMPKPHLVIFDMTTQKSDTIKNIKSYKLPEEGTGWLAVMLDKEKEKKKEGKDSTETENGEKPKKDAAAPSAKAKKDKPTGDKLVLQQFGDTAKWTFLHVKEYFFDKEGNYLYFHREKGDSANPAGLFRFNLERKRTSVVDSTAKHYKHFAASSSGQFLVFMSSNDTVKDEDEHTYTLFVVDGKKKFRAGGKHLKLPPNREVNREMSPYFSDNGEYLFFGVTEPQRKFEKDTLTPDDEKVKLDIWSHHDPYIQPMQLKNVKSDKQKSEVIQMNTDDLEIVTLTLNPDYSLSLNKKNLTQWVVAQDFMPYAQRLSWDYPSYRDYYMIDRKSGRSARLDTARQDNISMSPAGKYAYAFDRKKKKWFVYEIPSGKTLKVSDLIPTPLFDEDHDLPMDASPYGVAGFTKDDHAIVIYDRYDLWRVSLPGMETVRLTQGREKKIKYRYMNLDPDEFHLPEGEWTIWGMDENTKNQMLARLDPANGRIVVETSGPYQYSNIGKAKEADVFYYRKGNFEQYPELYVGSSFVEAEKISETNPQQKDYNWGQVELVTWVSLEGDTLEGLLYKPEDFSDRKKYPLLVYYYETHSDNLHQHRVPAPSASVINFPYFLSNGYIIFVPDIKYKTGNPGMSAFNCVIPGVNMLAQRPYIDKEKMALQGQSWGGYQTAFLITQTDMFACGMAGAPVSNMTSAYGGIRWGSGMSRGFQYEKSQSRLGTTMWDDLEPYIRNSPLFFADKVNTPLLMMHNDGDGAVPWYQGIEYYLALRRLNKPVWLLNYNGEEHNLMKRHNRKDLSVRMGQFFDHYLKDAPMPEWMKKGVPATQKGRNYGFELLPTYR